MAMMVGGLRHGLWRRTRTPSTTRAARQNRCSRSRPTRLRKAAPCVPATAKPAPGAPAPAVEARGRGETGILAPQQPAAAGECGARADGVQIEISSSQAVTPRVSKLNSPARVVVELPETVVASAQNKIPVGSAGVKGVRIGMDGKTPPTTSVVVDLEKALAYELTPGAAGKVVLTLHIAGATSARQRCREAKTAGSHGEDCSLRLR